MLTDGASLLLDRRRIVSFPAPWADGASLHWAAASGFAHQMPPAYQGWDHLRRFGPRPYWTAYSKAMVPVRA